MEQQGHRQGWQVSQPRSLESRAGGFRGPAPRKGGKGRWALGGKGKRLEAPGFQLYPGLVGRWGENREMKAPSADHWPKAGSKPHPLTKMGLP